MIDGSAAHGDHLVASQFDDEIDAHGTPALWRRARLCPCTDPSTGHPAIDCVLCESGLLWDAGLELKVFSPGRVREDIYDVAGLRMQGMIWLTFPTGKTPAHLDRIDLQAAVMVVNNERHVRGETRTPGGPSTERLRISPPIAVEFCEAIIAGVLTQYETPADFSIDGAGVITWVDGRGPAAGVQYTMRHTARPTFLCWDPQSRDEDSQRMPYKCRAQRYDFFRRKAVGDA
ncbi:MAG: hypothetical protein ABI629_10415 [bacterium]